MSTASELLLRHIETLVHDNAKWQTLISDDIQWELAYAPSIGHPARLSGREKVLHHVGWFLGAVEKFRFFDARVYPFDDRITQSPRLKPKEPSSLPAALTIRNMSFSCGRWEARLPFSENISIPWQPRKHWIFLFIYETRHLPGF